MLTGTAALVGGGLLALRPDGSLLGLPEEMLGTTPFADWRLPGLLLAGLVGAGFVTAGLLEHDAHRQGPAEAVLTTGQFCAWTAILLMAAPCRTVARAS